MHPSILVLGDPTLLHHMAGIGHFIRWKFSDGTSSISGPYHVETARHLARVYAGLNGLVEPPQTAPTFEELAEDMECQPGRRWWWMGTREGGTIRGIRGPFISRREALSTMEEILEHVKVKTGAWEASLYYRHDASAYPRTRKSRKNRPL